MTAGATQRRRAAPAARRPVHLAADRAETTAALIDRVAERALWLAVRMIHEANVVRPNEDGLKVGGHQASSASVAEVAPLPWTVGG